jgi:glycerol-3-phosphate acyltransferase PlsY
MEIVRYSFAIVLAYLIGAIPFGLLFTKVFSGVDVRSVGSGNIGATNVLRAAGKKAAVFTLLADCLKGLVPVLIVRLVLRDDALVVLTGIAAVLGHNFPVYLGFRGGKGVATSYGVILAATPLLGLICLLIWLGSALVWRYSSLSALISFLAYPFLVFSQFPESKALGALALFLAGMIYFRHRENIKRLVAGTESKIGQKK